MQGVQVRSPVGELRSHRLHSMAKKIKKKLRPGKFFFLCCASVSETPERKTFLNILVCFFLSFFFFFFTNQGDICCWYLECKQSRALGGMRLLLPCALCLK